MIQVLVRNTSFKFQTPTEQSVYVNISVRAGHEAVETVYLMNNEDQPFFFQFEEDSCHSAGFAAHLGVSPMSATIPAKSQ